MQKNWLVLTLLPVFLAVVGCTQNERREPAAVERTTPAPKSTTMTLSAEQLMALDWNGRLVERSMILDKRLVGTGVELDIRFPGNSPRVCSIDHTSSGAAGRRALVGLDVGRYEAFALKFSLISVNVRRDVNTPPEIAVGAVIGPAGDGRHSACEPIVLDLSADRATGIATTPMHTGKIRLIGIHVHAVNPQTWDANGGIVTVRVEPAPGTEVVVPPVDVREGSHREQDATALQRRTRTREMPAPAFGTKRVGAW
ncbi:MAG: hypothetical protein KBE65_19485 [Phycisphaerae bacterium]|nr:hypothetical protein [Phycisphaerae bacterium]